MLAPNSAETLLAHYGVPLAGAAIVALNTRLAPAEIAYIVDHAGIEVLIADAELFEGLGDEVPEALRLVLIAPDADGGQPDPARFGPRAEALDEALALASRSRCPGPSRTRTRSSPSTTPRAPRGAKGVMYTHRGAYLNALGEIVHQQLTPIPGTCGRCRCSTATDGAPHGRSPARANPRVCARSAVTRSGDCSTPRRSTVSPGPRRCCPPSRTTLRPDRCRASAWSPPARRRPRRSCAGSRSSGST